jgi:outer membrane lipopolysaccharide assembly protein LptE/RlpB
MRIVIILFVFLLAGCGYHNPDSSDSWVGGEARILYVQLFDNKTAEPYLENYITSALVAELSRSRVVVLTEDSELADVRLTGTVEDFSSKALAFGSTDRITDYRATMDISVRLLRKESSEVIWKNSMKRSEDYLATVNKNLQLEGERLAAREVSKRLAEDLHASLLNSF